MPVSPQDLLRRSGHTAEGEWTSLSQSASGQVWACDPYVVKSLEGRTSTLFQAEADGLEILRVQGCRTPRVHYVDAYGLVSERVRPGRSQWHDLADQLAGLHRSMQAHYEDTGPTYLGSFELPSAPRSQDWASFWRDHRMKPVLDACDLRHWTFHDALIQLLHTYVPPTEGPVWIHGDLWNGNVLMGEDGAVLIDPSVWIGERAVDLAMMTLFGGFPETFWRRYESVYPIPDAVRSALPFYQLYYLLVHVHLFGGHYLNSVESIVRRYGS